MKLAREPNVQRLVVDSGAFIRNVALQDVGVQVYTLEEVVAEVKDKGTRQRLQVLPYELHFRQPPPEAIKFVTEFSKKTGDYLSLSATDLKVLALTYMLEKEATGGNSIKSEPKTQVKSTGSNCEKPQTDGNSVGETEKVIVKEEEGGGIQVQAEELINNININEKKQDEDITAEDEGGEEGEWEDVEEGSETEEAEASDEEDEPDDDEDDDDGGGWITPGNIKQIKEALTNPDVERENIPVGCITTDFAMQNVLIQMGLHVVAADGMLIKKAKSYVLRCYACFKLTSNMTKIFCPNCGNKTLKRVAVEVDEEGNLRYFLSSKYQFNTRGLKFPLPKPRGGKHAKNPWLAEDQPFPQQRTSNADRVKYDALDPEYVAMTSPFAPKDTASRAAHLGISKNRTKVNYWDRRNPNEGRRGRSKRK